MNIGINGWFYSKPYTGIGQYTVNLVRELAALTSGGHNIAVFLNSDCNPAELPVIAGIEYLVVDKKAHGNDIIDILLFEYRLRSMASKMGIDVLHTPYLCSSLLHGNSFRHVVTVHDVIAMIFTGYRGSYLRQLFLSHNEKNVGKADLIITDSINSQKDIVKYMGMDESKVKVIALAADAAFQRAIDSARTKEVKTRYQLPDEYIFYIGGFDFRKNVKVLLEAYAAARSQGIKEQLVLGGAFNPSEKQLRKGVVENIAAIVRSLGIQEQVRFIGSVPQEDLPHIYRMARLFVYPSLYEGFGLPPLEAMCCGTPVLACDTSSIPEIINRGDLLFDPRDSHSLSEKLLWLLNDDKQLDEAAVWGIARASVFLWPVAARQTLDLYHAVFAIAR